MTNLVMGVESVPLKSAHFSETVRDRIGSRTGKEREVSQLQDEAKTGELVGLAP